jgi:hypothetical protein
MIHSPGSSVVLLCCILFAGCAADGSGASGTTGGTSGSGASGTTGGISGSGASDPAGQGGTASTTPLFPNAPSCDLREIRVTGSLAGEPYEGGGVPSNWLSTSITFGVGEVTGNTGSNEYELVFQQKLTLGAKVPITGGTFYVHEPHALASQYVCIRSGEIALVKAPPTDSVLIEFTISSAVLGRNCDGAPVDVALDGCLSRGSTYVP